MKVYLAGPMRGIPFFNFPAFAAYARLLRQAGYEVFSPAEEDIATHGPDFAMSNPTGSIEQAEKDYNFSLRGALGGDLKWICEQAEAIALMPGWECSKGAKAERATAEALGLQVLYVEVPCDDVEYATALLVSRATSADTGAAG